MKASLRQDIPASIVVFFVAVPLCLGIALASDAPPIAGLIAGIIGGLIVGFCSGLAYFMFMGFVNMISMLMIYRCIMSFVCMIVYFFSRLNFLFSFRTRS